MRNMMVACGSHVNGGKHAGAVNWRQGAQEARAPLPLHRLPLARREAPLSHRAATFATASRRLGATARPWARGVLPAAPSCARRRDTPPRRRFRSGTEALCRSCVPRAVPSRQGGRLRARPARHAPEACAHRVERTDRTLGTSRCCSGSSGRSCALANGSRTRATVLTSRYVSSSVLKHYTTDRFVEMLRFARVLGYRSPRRQAE